MKRISILLFTTAFTSGMLASCGGGGKEYAKEDATEDEANEETPVFSGKTAVGVVHSVADLDEWAKVYNEVSVPEGRLGYFVNVDNPDEIVVFELTTSHKEAKEAFASDDLKATMDRAGVTSEPSFTYYDVKYMDKESPDAMYRVGISHEVADYNAWKEKFDADEPRRAGAGLKLRALGTDADNPNLVHIFFATDDLEPIKGMLADPDMKATMDAAGVISQPVVSFWRKP